MWQGLPYAVGVIAFAIGIYCLLFKKNLIKIVIGLKIISDGYHLLLTSLGYRLGGNAPIYPVEGGAKAVAFAETFVDPLSQVLVLTSIVIGLCVTAVGLSLAVRAYRYWGVTDITELGGD